MKPSIHIIGDSTAAKKVPETRPESGWGEHLHLYLPDDFKIENAAVNGRSTKSFVDLGHFKFVDDALKTGDYLLIQFGHNDQKFDDPARFTEPFNSYQENLRNYVAAARAKDVTPIILTSVTRRAFDEGQLDPKALGDYPRAALEVAKELDVQTIDVFSLTQNLVQSLGDEKSKELYLHLAEGEHSNYPDGVFDDTHFNETGAKVVAELIAKEFLALTK